MKFLADEIWPDKECEKTLAERQIKIADGKDPADRPENPAYILCDKYVFHIAIILFFRFLLQHFSEAFSE